MRKLIIPPNSGTQLAGKHVRRAMWGEDSPNGLILFVARTDLFLRFPNGVECAAAIKGDWYEVDPPADAVTWERLGWNEVTAISAGVPGITKQLNNLRPTHIEIDGKAVPLVFLVRKEGV